jgi:hypothetical protein
MVVAVTKDEFIVHAEVGHLVILVLNEKAGAGRGQRPMIGRIVEILPTSFMVHYVWPKDGKDPYGRQVEGGKVSVTYPAFHAAIILSGDASEQAAQISALTAQLILTLTIPNSGN